MVLVVSHRLVLNDVVVSIVVCIVVMHNIMVVVAVVLGQMRNIFINHIMAVIVKGSFCVMTFSNHMILVLMAVLMMLSNGCVGSDNLWVMANVRCCVMNGRLRRVMRVLVVNDWLVIDAVVMVMLVAVMIFSIVIIMVHMMAVIELIVMMMAKSVLDFVMMLLIVVFEAKVLWMVIRVTTISVQLGTMVQVMVIRVHILNNRLMVMNLFMITVTWNILYHGVVVIIVMVDPNHVVLRLRLFLNGSFDGAE